MKFDKVFFIDFISLALVAVSFYVSNNFKEYFYYAGLFAFSGAVTNQLAIYMLFEKVPFLYGSGIITLKFESFKKSIKSLIMNEFFTKKQLDAFFAKEESKIDLSPIVEKTDFTPAYEALKQSVMESSFGGMLSMFGGEKALEPLKGVFIAKLKNSILSITKSDTFSQMLQNSLVHSSVSDDLMNKIEKIVDDRLEQLTPVMVKDIVKNMIQEYLGWLVFWGGIFGGFLGIISVAIGKISI